ncbi:glial cell line-derived neurotrophic factor [Clupea harengus]|uniref:Glial cell line-derived neurotrophic factor n=1 Tax=Clupea harengus TaxID=7950 RepID=A0A6P3VXW2_CLUHA|nr:glial cell line-derived neurotrophic factor [Clupea harengus]
MKLWDKVFTCYLLLDHVLTNPLLRSLQSLPGGPLRYDSQRRLDASSSASESRSITDNRQQKSPFKGKDDMATQSPQQLEDVLDFIKSTISSLRRSAEQGKDSVLREKRSRRRVQMGGGRGQRGGTRAAGQGGRRQGKGSQGHGCKLKQVQLNVSDLGLGYQTKEEMIFKYCSGPCANSETNYDKILNNLTQNKKLLRDSPPHACCRPIAFDDDLSFLDDNLIYHTMKRHSARKCGCV